MRILHVLPHRGGGAETYVDMLERLPETAHARAPLSAARTPLRAAPSIAARWPAIARAAGGADVVHAHGDVAAMLALPLLRGRASVVTTHGLHMLRRAAGPAGAAVRAGMRAVVATASVTLCCSSDEHADLVDLVPPPARDRLAVVPNGIDLPPADPGVDARARLGLPADGTVALFLGQLEERKDPLTAVRAANAAAARGAPLTLLVAGEGPLLAAVRAEAGPAVRILGFRRDVADLLGAADVSVMPSRREGISFAVLEAMGRGHAMVVADGPGNPEAVGDAGLVLPAGDVDAFADALAELARDAARRTRLGAAARARVEASFTAERLLDGVAAAYRRATAPSRAGGAAPA